MQPAPMRLPFGEDGHCWTLLTSVFSTRQSLFLPHWKPPHSAPQMKSPPSGGDLKEPQFCRRISLRHWPSFIERVLSRNLVQAKDHLPDCVWNF